MTEELANWIDKYGFYMIGLIACAIFIAMSFIQLHKDSKEREEVLRREANERETRLSRESLQREQRLYEQIERSNATLGRATETIDRMNIRLDVIEDKLDDLKNEVRSK